MANAKATQGSLIPVDVAAIVGRFVDSRKWDAEGVEAEKTTLTERIARKQEQIEAMQQEVADIQANLETIDNREKIALKLAKEAALAMGKFASEGTILAVLAEKFPAVRGVAATGGTRAPKAVNADLKALVLGALDRDGKTVGAIAKELGKDSKELTPVLQTLMTEGKASKEGERRGTKYLLS